jgi:hypothetical protein
VDSLAYVVRVLEQRQNELAQVQQDRAWVFIAGVAVGMISAGVWVVVGYRLAWLFAQ